jgi:hypothetical protein
MALVYIGWVSNPSVGVWSRYRSSNAIEIPPRLDEFGDALRLERKSRTFQIAGEAKFDVRGAWNQRGVRRFFRSLAVVW